MRFTMLEHEFDVVTVFFIACNKVQDLKLDIILLFRWIPLISPIKAANEKISPIKVVGEWYHSNAAHFVLVVKNAVDIDSYFSKCTLENY